MFDAIATLLAWYYDLWPSYGVAIILLTLTIMVILLPLTLKGTRSMMMMQALQPEIKRLQARYKDDREALQQEMLGLYRENNINPVGGCLPLLIQLPVFIVLYRVLHGLTRIPAGESTFNPGYISHNSALYKALSGSRHMYSWGLDLSESAVEAMQRSFFAALPIVVLILCVAGSSLYQQRQIQGRNPNATAINQQQQIIMKVMPVMLAIFCVGLPSAMVIYFFVSNLFRVAQQAFISHKIYKPAIAAGLFEGKAREADTSEPKGSGKPTLQKPAAQKPSATKPRSGSGGAARQSGQQHRAKRSSGSPGKQAGRPVAGRPANDSGSASGKAPAEPVAAADSKSKPAPDVAPEKEPRKGSMFDRLLGEQAKGPAAGSSGRSGRAGARDRNGAAATPTPASRTTPPPGGRVTAPGSPVHQAKRKKKRK